MDLIVAEEKLDDDVGYVDYQNLFSFTAGNKVLFGYLFVSIIAAAVQLIPSYIMAKWTQLNL